MKRLTPAQLKKLKFPLFIAKNDWDFAIQPIVKSMPHTEASKEALRQSAAHALWLTVTDYCSTLGIDVPDYKDARGQLRKLTDAEAMDAAEQAVKSLWLAVRRAA